MLNAPFLLQITSIRLSCKYAFGVCEMFCYHVYGAKTVPMDVDLLAPHHITKHASFYTERDIQ